MPPRTPLIPGVFGRVERAGYSVEKVYLETHPGFFLGGNLYRPTGRPGPFPAILHCFTGSRQLAFAGVELGCYVSFSGILTFKKSDELRSIAADLPADRILVETDAPYLAPGKFRGKRNEPAYVMETAKVLAEVRGVSLHDVARLTTDNFHQVFSKVPQSEPVVA
jgi:TatD DNase family protein